MLSLLSSFPILQFIQRFHCLKLLQFYALLLWFMISPGYFHHLAHISNECNFALFLCGYGPYMYPYYMETDYRRVDRLDNYLSCLRTYVSHGYSFQHTSIEFTSCNLYSFQDTHCISSSLMSFSRRGPFRYLSLAL